VISIPLSDEDWSLVSHLFIEDKVLRFGRAKRPAHEVLDAVLWVIVNGEKMGPSSCKFPSRKDLLHEISDMEKMGCAG
jgi:hypothetical protein